MTYFPEPVSGWLFLSVMFAFLAAAAVVDHRRSVIPKWITLPMFGLGLLANVLRGMWQATHGGPNWALIGETWWIGAADGLLFAIAGFLVGFGLFFVLWILGVCGGGDVKLFGALGAWVGSLLIVYVLMATLLVLFVVTLGLMGRRMLAGRLPQTGTNPGKRQRKTLVRYGLIVLTAAVPVVVWSLRADLGLNGGPKADASVALKRDAQRSPRRRRRHGALTIELLFVLPILLLLLFGMVQFSFLLTANQRMELAAREGARAAATCGTQETILETVLTTLGPNEQDATVIVQVENDPAITLTPPPPPDPGEPLNALTGDAIAVTVTLPFNEAVPNMLQFFGIDTSEYNLIARVVMRKE